MSFIKASTKPLENWSKATLDKILIKSDLLYANVTSLVGQQYLLPDELPSKIPIEGGSCHNILRIVGNKTPSYTIGLLRTNNQPMISVFDSHSRDTSGLSSPDGTAIVTTHPTMRHLVKFIRDLVLSLSLGDSCSFEIAPVSIMVHRTDCNVCGL
ncbi:hypothetical protein ACJMK2_025420 [Sinanodonta woodiana]|uniref:Uncharacterized protein n=1 Tax=Sinanodonta woodiana TaxID=1069815 RepID=A0ABD3XGJ8_SINWO